MSKGRLFSTSAAFVVLICFFLPWITVSCSEQEIATMSGLDLAVGTDIDLGVGREEVEPDLIIFIVPLAALVVMGLVLLSAVDIFPGSLTAAGQVAAASIGLLVLAYKWLDSRGGTPESDLVSFSPEIGLWGVVIGLIAIIVGATFSLLAAAQSTPLDPGEF